MKDYVNLMFRSVGPRIEDVLEHRVLVNVETVADRAETIRATIKSKMPLVFFFLRQQMCLAYKVFSVSM